jgi:hypothetical protein
MSIKWVKNLRANISNGEEHLFEQTTTKECFLERIEDML